MGRDERRRLGLSLLRLEDVLAGDGGAAGGIAWPDAEGASAKAAATAAAAAPAAAADTSEEAAADDGGGGDGGLGEVDGGDGSPAAGAAVRLRAARRAWPAA
eukprot:5118509-Prymnesium_polylepis.1